MSVIEAVDTESATIEQLRTALRLRIERANLDLSLLPQIAGQVLLLTTDERADATTLSALVQRDQALASHVLRVANSAAFGGNSPVITLQQAVARLGLDLLRDIALALSLRSHLFRLPGQETEATQLWRHALASGVYARQVARLRPVCVDTAFLCGLLRNIGRPVVLRALVDLKHAFGLELGAPATSLLVEEFHVQAGKRLAEKWTLPEAVAAAIAYGDGTGPAEPGAKAPSQEVLVGAVSDLLATLVLAPVDASPAAVLAHPAARALGLDDDEATLLLHLRGSVLKVVDASAG